MPTWYFADQSRSAASASSEHQCRFAGASCTRARGRVLRPHFSHRSVKMPWWSSIGMACARRYSRSCPETGAGKRAAKASSASYASRFWSRSA